MNWNEIKEKYPKSYRELMLWDKKDPCKICSITIRPRDLYDFFDDNEIYIYPRITLYEIDNIKQFECDIYGSGIRTARLIWYKNRHEAEEAGFIKAFEILEKRLNNP